MQHRLYYIIGITAAAVLASCSDDAESPYLNGKDKTPVVFSALLDKANRAQTRAENMSFENNDKLITYLRHVTWDGSTTGVRELVTVGNSPKLVTLSKGSDNMLQYTGADITPIGTSVALGINSSNTQMTADLTATPAIFWDDFSQSSESQYDLRTAGHYLQSYYGYCYNGNTPSTSLTPETGVLGWTVSANQSTGIKTSDLLWSAEQTPISYSHESTQGLVLPYTHAMSKVTVEIKCEEGFIDDENNFKDASVELTNVNTAVKVTAPTAQLSEFGTSGTITMHPVEVREEDASNMTKSFEALIAPTVMKQGMKLANINGIDGNNYELKLTNSVLTTAVSPASPWSSQLADANATSVSYGTAANYDADGNGGLTKPGVNYHITVHVNKQAITVEALIRNWDEVTAETTGEINFAKDVNTISVSGEKKGSFTNSFDLYLKDEDADSYGEKATTATWVDDAWTYSPGYAYWPQDNLPLYFRALSGADATTPLKLATNNDLMWGTTDAHSGKDINNADYIYNENDAIDPRTKYIPLIFYHTMSKVKFILQNNQSAPEAEKVNLEGATIQLTNLYGSATLDLHTGTISDSGHTKKTNLFDDPSTTEVYEQAATTYSEGKASTELYLVPQGILDESRIVITLADGTKYSAQLNKCKVDTSSIEETHAPNSVVAQWYRNVSYIYTITLGKEEILFQSHIKAWETVDTSGNATLEWD